MGHPDIENSTPFAFEALFISDENGRPILTPIVKATFDIGPEGNLELAEDQLPVDFVGKHYGDPAITSMKYEPETAFIKLRTDVVLIGHAHAPRGRATEIDVSLQIGPAQKTVRVFGNRHWEKDFMRVRMTAPEPFEKIPLIYERAYGGWDRSHEDPAKHGWEARNPIGVGFHCKGAKVREGDPLPNLEDPRFPVTKYAGRSMPAGFGFVSPNWEPRASLAGTYDARWERDRCPRLPLDFERAHFNAAPIDLITPGYLRGDERVTVLHATPEGRLDFALPGIHPPECLVSRRNAGGDALSTNLDTVIIDTDDMRLTLIWRNATDLREGPSDVKALKITCENAPVSEMYEEPRGNVIPLVVQASP